uniref:Uncharacterized protein n=1 Tax=Plectus sambesii TaxID=2011161 RepID=A0A914X467_9BILA
MDSTCVWSLWPLCAPRRRPDGAVVILGNRRGESAGSDLLGGLDGDEQTVGAQRRPAENSRRRRPPRNATCPSQRENLP